MRYLIIPINDITDILLNSNDNKMPQIRQLFTSAKKISLSDEAIEAAAITHSVADGVWSRESYRQALIDLTEQL